MDWSTNDYTRTYSDTFFLPNQDHDTGIYLLDEGGAGPKNSWLGPDTGDAPDPRIRAPIRPFAGGCGGRPRGARRESRERYYTGGNIISARENNRAIFDAAWDERPLHYNPNSGGDWAHLVPPRSRRPYGGGPAPSLAFPMITTSEAQVGPKDLFAGSLAPPRAPEMSASETLVQLIKVVLLFVIVVLLALTLAAAARLERQIERSLKASGSGGV